MHSSRIYGRIVSDRPDRLSARRVVSSRVGGRPRYSSCSRARSWRPRRRYSWPDLDQQTQLKLRTFRHGTADRSQPLRMSAFARIPAPRERQHCRVGVSYLLDALGASTPAVVDSVALLLTQRSFEGGPDVPPHLFAAVLGLGFTLVHIRSSVRAVARRRCSHLTGHPHTGARTPSKLCWRHRVSTPGESIFG